MRGWLVALVALVAAAAFPVAAGAAELTPQQAADRVNQRLFDAQTELVLSGRKAAVTDTRQANPQADATITEALDAAAAAVKAGDRTELAAARGSARAGLFKGAYTVTVEATTRGDAKTARRWLLLREFRTATRFTRPGATGTLALEQLARGTLTADTATQAVKKDLLDAYQARLRELLADARRGIKDNLPERRAEASAQAAGYFQILAPRYAEDRGGAAEKAASQTFDALPEAADLGAALDQAGKELEGFTAAPFTAEEAARRAQQLLQFLALVPVEYGRGVKGDHVTRDFEITEAVAFRTGAVGALGDLRDQLAKRDQAKTDEGAAALDALGKQVEFANKNKDGVPRPEQVEATATKAQTALTAAMPKAWTQKTDESDYDLINLTLDRMEAAIGAGQYRQAEQARLEAYAFFEFGPERRLRSFDQGLALDIEGLIWFGAAGQDGLAKQIAQRAPRRAIRETRLALDGKLSDAAATLGDSANKATVVTNSAIIVFREGLEGVLILAAITASMVGLRARLRRPV